MDIKLSRGEYWLLLHVAQHVYSIYDLAGSDDYIYSLYNKQTHGLDRRRLADLFVELFEKGWIEAFYCSATPRKTLIPDREMITDIFFGSSAGPDYSDLYYQLSPEGGRVWESFAAPLWDRFVDFRHYDGRTGELVAASEDMARQFIWVLPQAGYQIGDVRKETLSPWQATYWKRLPVGYMMTFKCDFEEAVDPATDQSHQLDWLKRQWLEWGCPF